MLVSRISRRVLTEHHLALTQGLAEQENPRSIADNVGIIFTGLSVKRSLDKYIKMALTSLHQSDQLRRDPALQDIYKLPDIVVDGEVDATFSYIREHLEYILLELLLNVSFI
jgi:pyruvate dehydrogenase kinase 2/3/4